MAQKGKPNIYLILAHIAITLLQTHAEPQTIFRPGAILTKTNRAYISSSRWMLITEFDFAHIAIHIEHLHKLTKYTIAQQEQIYKKFAFAPDLAERIAQHSRTRAASITRQISAISTQVNDVIGALTRPTTSRKRRALISLGGSILKKLFGTATTEDVKRLRELLVKQEKQHETIFHLQHYQITLFNKTNTLFKSLFKRTMELGSRLYFLQEDIRVAVANFTAIVERTFLTTRLSNTHLFMDNLLRDTRYFRDLFLRFMDMLLHKRLSTELLAPKQLYRALIGISSRLPSSLSVLPDIDGALINIYKTSRLTVDFLGTTAYIKIAVPLLNRHNILDVFHITFIPHHFSNQRLALFTSQADTNLLATADRTYFITLNDDELDRACANFGTLLYCSLKRPLHSFVMQSCELGLLLSNHSSAACNFTLNSTHPETYSHIGGHQWAFSVPHKTLATIFCRTNSRMQTSTLTLTNTGIITIPPFCSLFTNTTQILPAGTITSQAEPLNFKFYSPTIYEPHNNLTFGDFLHNNLPHFNTTTHVTKAIADHTQFKPLPLAHLSDFYNSLETNTQLPRYTDLHTLVPHISYPVVLFIIIVVFFCYYKQRRPQPTTARANSPQPSNRQLLAANSNL